MIGPIAGGLLYEDLGVEKGYTYMAVFGAFGAIIFVLLGLCLPPDDFHQKEPDNEKLVKAKKKEEA